MMLLAEALEGFPPPVAVPASDVAGRSAGAVFVVLDDDPTGTQSVADLPVLTSWAVEDIAWALEQGLPAFYVLTNTRSLSPSDTAVRNREIAANALRAARPSGTQLLFVSRSDSTLRGHFPLETDTLASTIAETTGATIDAVVLVPAFPDAGRVTIGSEHYMLAGEELTRVSDTEFARDATFGFPSSNLRAYVSAKTGGRLAADDVLSLTLDTIRGGPEQIADLLGTATDGRAVVADAVTEDDLRLIALGCHLARTRGSRILFRVGPPFVRAAIGQEPHPPLTASEVYGDNAPGSGGGLVVVGSHVGVTSRQLHHLTLARPQCSTVVIEVEQVISDTSRPAHLDDVVTRAIDGLATGDVIVHTSRTLVTASDGEQSLAISRAVSAAVVDVVRRILESAPPRFVIAKGGITSSDVAVHGLSIRRAMVRGPMLPGIVSLWEPTDGPARGIPYVVFAGNVGSDASLTDVVRTLAAHAGDGVSDGAGDGDPPSPANSTHPPAPSDP
ncbi:hypothetical protein B8W74_08135 [Arthrobacter agilis]|nr:hypothetical protein B8W74_08135 [Arthrobacter agilis]